MPQVWHIHSCVLLDPGACFWPMLCCDRNFRSSLSASSRPVPIIFQHPFRFTVAHRDLTSGSFCRSALADFPPGVFEGIILRLCRMERCGHLRLCRMAHSDAAHVQRLRHSTPFMVVLEQGTDFGIRCNSPRFHCSGIVHSRNWNCGLRHYFAVSCKFVAINTKGKGTRIHVGFDQCL